MVNWVNEILGLITLSGVQDDRIKSLVPSAQGDVRSRLGSALYDSLAADENRDWKLSVSQFLISRLLLAVREVNQGQAIPDSKGLGIGWGDGQVRPSASEDLISMSKYWRSLADETIVLIKKEHQDTSSDPVGWYDI